MTNCVRARRASAKYFMRSEETAVMWRKLPRGNRSPVPFRRPTIPEPRLRLQARLSRPPPMAEPTTDERPLRADARRNRERILAAARTACAEHGAAGQIDDGARSAAGAPRPGGGAGTVSRHFPTKDALIEALVAEKIRVTTENLREALEIDDPWEAFAAGIRRNAEVMAADAALREALIRLGPAARASEAAYAEVNEVAAQLITRAQEAGAVRDDVTVDDVGALIGGLCASMGHPELDWRRHLDVLLDGLRARG